MVNPGLIGFDDVVVRLVVFDTVVNGNKSQPLLAISVRVNSTDTIIIRESFFINFIISDTGCGVVKMTTVPAKR